MSEPKWTPGPWRYEEFPSREVLLKRRHWAVGQVNAPARGVGLAFGETDANARLIAAAPELYDELENARAIIAGEAPQYGEAITRIDALLAKARGEP